MISRVSIIVPVFNVVDYLERCVNSLRKQTWSNLEILLIDDGSSDGSDVLCDRLAAQDERILVIHQSNAGLSAARNAGLDLSTGEYLTFVDSDDWVHPQYVELMLRAQKQTDSRMVICNWIHCSEEKDYDVSTGEATVISKEDAIPRMLKGEWISAWAKLYHRSLFNGIRFPSNKNNEDYAILIYLFDRCNSFCLIPDVLYYYFKREGSITRSPLNAHSFDEWENATDVWNYCRSREEDWGYLALFNVTASIIKLSGNCLLANRFEDKYSQMRFFVSTHKKIILRNPALPFKYYPFIWAMLIGPSVHRAFMKTYYKKKCLAFP